MTVGAIATALAIGNALGTLVFLLTGSLGTIVLARPLDLARLGASEPALGDAPRRRSSPRADPRRDLRPRSTGRSEEAPVDGGA